MLAMRTVSVIASQRERQAIMDSLVNAREVQKTHLGPGPGGWFWMDLSLSQLNQLCKKVQPDGVVSEDYRSTIHLDSVELGAVLEALRSSRNKAPGGLSADEVDGMYTMLISVPDRVSVCGGPETPA